MRAKKCKNCAFKKDLAYDDNPSDLKLNMQAEILLDLLIGINFSQIFKPKPLVTDNGHPERAFFQNLKLLGLGRQIGQKFYEAFGVFLAKL